MNQIKLNLLPVEFRVRKKDLTWILDPRIFWTTFLMIISIAVCAFVYVTTYDDIQTLEGQLITVNKEIEKKKPIIQKIKRIEQQLKEIQRKNLALQSIQVSKKRWIVIFENLSSVISQNTWFSRFAQDQKNTVASSNSKFDPNIMSLTGVTHQFSEVAEYMVDLESFNSIDKVLLKNINTVQLGGGDQGFEFVIIIHFNPHIGLDVKKLNQIKLKQESVVASEAKSKETKK